jgi:hypothetical protein
VRNSPQQSEISKYATGRHYADGKIFVNKGEMNRLANSMALTEYTKKAAKARLFFRKKSGNYFVGAGSAGAGCSTEPSAGAGSFFLQPNTGEIRANVNKIANTFFISHPPQKKPNEYLKIPETRFKRCKININQT